MKTNLKFGDKIQVYDTEWINAIYLEEDDSKRANLFVLSNIEGRLNAFWTDVYLKGWKE